MFEPFDMRNVGYLKEKKTLHTHTEFTDTTFTNDKVSWQHIKANLLLTSNPSRTSVCHMSYRV